jgi:hypothetical protein
MKNIVVKKLIIFIFKKNQIWKKTKKKGEIQKKTKK